MGASPRALRCSPSAPDFLRSAVGEPPVNPDLPAEQPE